MLERLNVNTETARHTHTTIKKPVCWSESVNLAHLSHSPPYSPPPASASAPHAHPGPSIQGLHPSGNRPGLVTHHGDDGLTAHLRERPGPSGKQAQSCIKYEGEKENMFYLFLARTEGKGDRNVVCAVCIKTWSWHAALERVHVRGFHSGQLSSLNKVDVTQLFVP